MTDRLRGIFPVLQTPLTADGAIDMASMERQVAFCIAAGAHGLVYPVLGSEFQFLTDQERHRMVEVVANAAAGKVPLVVGVAGSHAAVAREHAAHAAGVGAAAVVSLPPYVAPASQAEIFDYYRAISEAAGVPVMIQNTAPGLDARFLARLVREIEHVQYVKEEMSPSAHNLSVVVREAGEHCLGVFGGAYGRWMLSEMRRGAAGFMPAAEISDVYVQVWERFEAGDEPEARAIFNKILPLINLLMLIGLRVSKEVLVRRGVFQTALMRWPGQFELDDDDHFELEAVLDELRPLFRVNSLSL
jgi:dihydrodipicolinate synthase/N-acetylneuraminate lyase